MSRGSGRAANTIKLSDRDRKLIEDNIACIYSYFYKYHIDDEDIRQHLFYKVCCSIGLYDESKGKITTFIYKALNNAYGNIYYHNNMKKRKGLTYSLDGILSEDIDERGLSISSDKMFEINETLAPIDDHLLTEDLKETVTKYVQHSRVLHTDRDKEIVLKHWLNNVSRTDLSKEYNLSRMRIGQLINNTKAELYKKMKTDYDLREI